MRSISSALFGRTTPGIYDRINGDKDYDHGTAPASMDAFDLDPNTYETYAYPSSRHPGGVNMAFCGGSVDFIRENIDPGVYGQLMTSNSKRSTLVVGGVPDRKLTPLSDDQYH